MNAPTAPAFRAERQTVRDPSHLRKDIVDHDRSRSRLDNTTRTAAPRHAMPRKNSAAAMMRKTMYLGGGK
ncbi:hypothetical protein BURKHO8Y_70173 [Burkholderia sp. 8Y]|uniref:hypothetical protein n=1 Tax=Burkholderia sp. 8Y TaxID=2653133 RepID=UPI0012F0550F|nr:hypothetical protein [Burkholderia sp. 8Y]VXC97266.1 hypothetical protein BURKHO8Y_70173 [Burkholderia sp. 8Y]